MCVCSWGLYTLTVCRAIPVVSYLCDEEPGSRHEPCIVSTQFFLSGYNTIVSPAVCRTTRLRDDSLNNVSGLLLFPRVFTPHETWMLFLETRYWCPRTIYGDISIHGCVSGVVDSYLAEDFHYIHDPGLLFQISPIISDWIIRHQSLNCFHLVGWSWICYQYAGPSAIIAE